MIPLTITEAELVKAQYIPGEKRSINPEKILTYKAVNDKVTHIIFDTFDHYNEEMIWIYAYMSASQLTRALIDNHRRR